MEDGRRTRWAIYVAPLLLAGLATAPARADLLVGRLNHAAVDQAMVSRCVVEERATPEARPEANVDADALALAVMATVLFSNPENSNPPPGGGSTTPVTPSGGNTPPPTSEAPEPATLLSALVGMGLAGLYAAFRRKNLIKMEGMPAA
jgi:hypothetical protein